MPITDADADDMTFALGWMLLDQEATVPEGYTVEDADRDEALEAHRDIARLQEELAAAAVRRQDAVIRLRDRHGWSHQLVAELLGVSRGTAQGIAERRTASGTVRARRNAGG